MPALSPTLVSYRPLKCGHTCRDFFRVVIFNVIKPKFKIAELVVNSTVIPISIDLRYQSLRVAILKLWHIANYFLNISFCFLKTTSLPPGNIVPHPD